MREVLSGLAFGEGPRWHDGRLWLSDMHANQVLVLSEGAGDLANQTAESGGTAGTEVVCEVPGKPSGLGWLPDGRLLVVSMTDRRILRLEADGTSSTHADLSELIAFDLNDMVVDAAGNAYVGHFGFDFHSGTGPAPADIVLVRADGSFEIVARDMQFPNGSVITDGGSTLVVAESMAGRLTAFDIAPDGTLSDRRTWADLDGMPDGICLDAEGAIWYADPGGARCVRVRQGGDVLQRVQFDLACYACALGGPQGRTLFSLLARYESLEQVTSQRTGRVVVSDVRVPGAGLS